MHTLHPAWHPVPRGGDKDPGEQERPAGLAHHGEAKGLWLLPLKTTAGEAQGREKQFKLLYNIDTRAKYKLPLNKAGPGMTGFFTAGGGELSGIIPWLRDGGCSAQPQGMPGVSNP